MANTDPLFPDSAAPDDDTPAGYVVPASGPAADASRKQDRDAAAAVIRKKLEKIYANEPDAAVEMTEAEVIKPRSKHQIYMHELSQSGKSLAEIQTAWHHYYVTLPDNEKHEVWREFYESNSQTSKYHQTVPKQSPQLDELLAQKGLDTGPVTAVTTTKDPKYLAVHPAQPKRAPHTIRERIVRRVTADGKLKAKHHVQSLLFGLSMGFIVLFIFLFGFFNEFFIAPFIQPSRHANATPLILSSNSVAPTATPEIIIPKINVEIPVDYTQTSTNENIIENALENGVVHYPTTSLPGQVGNTAFFGHSSNNIFNKGKYKFAFVLLHTLVPGDTFYLTYGGKVYVYKVISRTVVEPSNVGVLNPVPGQTATATLITCDPPGTSLHRLIVVGQQVSPDPAGNTGSTAGPSGSSHATQLPGNGPTAWTRFWRWVF